MVNQNFYTYRITWSDEDQEFVGLCSEFPGLSWLEKDSGTALDGIRKLVAETIIDMESNGEKVPEPIAMKKFSGHIPLRVTPGLHRRLSLEAAEAGVSLNRLVSDKLSRD